jgi:hypothetical protein
MTAREKSRACFRSWMNATRIPSEGVLPLRLEEDKMSIPNNARTIDSRAQLLRSSLKNRYPLLRKALPWHTSTVFQP